jgi:cobalt-zinc-cadmium efflux system membrane fusion protein
MISVRSFAVAAFAGLLGLAGCRRPVPPPEPPQPTVHGEQVSFPSQAPQLAYLTVEPARPMAEAVRHLTGRLYWSDDTTVRVFSPVTGRVLGVTAKVGDTVAKGSPLAQIDSPDFDQARADVRTAAANLEAAEKTRDRAHDLFAHGAAAAKDVEAADAAAVAAQAERDRAAGRWALYGGTPGGTTENFQLQAPMPGVVVQKNINPGQEVRADQMLANANNLVAPLFVIGDPSQLWLQIDAAQGDLPQISVNQPLQVRSRAFPDQVFTGHVADIGYALDPTTRAALVRGVVDNPGHKLRAEMYVQVDILRGTSSAQPPLETSAKALFMIGQQNYLFVKTGPADFVRRAVTVGSEQDGKVPIYSGLAGGDQVVVEGGLLLQSILEPAN